MIRTLRACLLVMSVSCVATSAAAQGSDHAARFLAAESRFAEGAKLAGTDPKGAAGAFVDAAAGWRALRDEGLRNSALETNIGNASLLAGDVGRAVAAYRRAIELDPANTRAADGLSDARRRAGTTGGPTGPAGGMLDAMRRVVAIASPDVLLILATAAYFGAWLLIAPRVAGRPGPGVRWAAALLVTGAALAAPVWMTRRAASDDAVIVVPSVARNGPSDAIYAEAFDKPLAAGSEVSVLESRGSWVRVKLPDGRDAWVPRSAIELVAG
jgi:hypothetical protein